MTTKVIKILLLIVIGISMTNCSEYFLYMSPVNFYRRGELSVKVINIPAASAPVEMDIYVPQAPFRYPVVIFQHGFTASIKGYETIMTHLASHGFVVVVPQMYPPGDFYNIPTPEEEAATLGGGIVTWMEDSIQTIVPINADMVLLGLCGHSRGGQIAYRMALEITDKVRALAGVDPVDALAMFGQNTVITGAFDV